MTSSRWRTALVVGGVGSGQWQYAQTLLADAQPRHLQAHDGADVDSLAQALRDTTADETVLVEGLEHWLAATSRGGRRAASASQLAALVAAIGDCPARLVLAGTEFGLTAPSSAAARSSAEAVGALHQAVAGAVDAAALVVAGQAIWLKTPGQVFVSAAQATVSTKPTPGAATSVGADLPDLGELPQPDESARETANEQLVAAGLGALANIAGFAAATQATATPTPWQTVRALVLHGDHQGAAAAGALGSQQRAAQLHQGGGALATLAAAADVSLRVVPAATAAPIEEGPAISNDDAEAALSYGWQLSEQAADEGVDLLVLGSIGDGAETAAAAVAVSLGGVNTDPAAVLGRVRALDGTIDDAAWIQRCVVVRDATRRTRSDGRLPGRTVLAELAGADIAIATGVILGAAARRTPVLLDGPVGAAAALVARSLAAASRRWCLVPDHGGHPAVVRACEMLGLTPLVDLNLDLGEGATALAVLPLLRSALSLPAGTLAVATPA